MRVIVSWLVGAGLCWGGVTLWAKPQSDPRYLLRCYEQARREGQVEKAQKVLQYLSEYYGNLAVARVAVAREAMRTGQWDYAYALLADALRLGPRCVEVRMARAEILRLQNRITEAMQELDTVLRIAPEHEISERAAGLLFLMQGQFEAAIVRFTRYLNQTDEQDANVYYWRGLAWLRSGRPDNAEADFAKALQLAPDLSELWLHRAQALEAKGELEKAAEAFDRYLVKNTQDYEARLAYAKLLERLSRRGEALQQLYLVLQHQPNRQDVLKLVYGSARRLRRYHLALEVLDRLLQLNPDDPELWFQKAVILDFMYRDKEALAALDECENRFAKAAPANTGAPPAVWAARGNFYRKLGQLEEALRALDKAIALSPQFDYAYYLRADVLWRMGKVREALANLDRVQEVNADYAALYVKRAELLRAQGKWTEALQQLDQAVKLAPAMSFARTQRAGMLLLLGRWDEAADQFAHFPKNENDHPSTLAYAQALLAALKGDWSEAEQLAEKHLRENPTDALSTYNLACAWALFADIRVRKFGAAPCDSHVQLYKQRALALLEKTFQLGYSDRWHVVHDPDLSNLQLDPAFWQIVGTTRPLTEP